MSKRVANSEAFQNLITDRPRWSAELSEWTLLQNVIYLSYMAAQVVRLTMILIETNHCVASSRTTCI